LSEWQSVCLSEWRSESGCVSQWESACLSE